MRHLNSPDMYKRNVYLIIARRVGAISGMAEPLCADAFYPELVTRTISRMTWLIQAFKKSYLEKRT